MFDTCIKIMFVCDLYYKGPGRWVQTSGSPRLDGHDYINVGFPDDLEYIVT